VSEMSNEMIRRKIGEYVQALKELEKKELEIKRVIREYVKQLKVKR
jgi:hypothetical protein